MKSKYLLNVCLGLALCGVYMNASATSDGDGGRMHVQIGNATESTCQLISYTLNHGVLDSAPPQSLMSHDSKTFDVEQLLLGPDIVLAYKCDAKYISFQVQQDSSIFMGHEPTVTVLVNHGLALDSNSQSSSVLWTYPGIINISIKSTS